MFSIAQNMRINSKKTLWRQGEERSKDLLTHTRLAADDQIIIIIIPTIALLLVASRHT
jgi:hypothetical protein